MSVYDSRRVNRMRQEAIRRTQEMRARSAPAASAASSPVTPSKDTPLKKSNDKLKGLLGELIGDGLDADKLLIAALLLLLIREKADKKLILALGYILI